MAKEWEPPEGHPLSVEQAKELIAGDLGNLYRSIISRCCAPIYWYYPRGEIINSGTVTFARTPRRLMAITAAHVVRGYERDHAAASRPMHLQVLNAIFNMEVIAISDDLNLATLAIDEALLPRIGKAIEPLSSWPPRVPEEGRGIMLAGYPALDRAHPKPMVVEWGLLTALCIARRVIRDQITWVAERSPDIITDLPPKSSSRRDQRRPVDRLV